MMRSAVAATSCGSVSVITSEAGSGFSPSRAATASLALRLDMEVRYSSSASSLVL